MGLTPHPHLVCRGPRKSRVIPLLTLRAFVAYKRGATYLLIRAQQRWVTSRLHAHNVPFNCLRTLISCKTALLKLFFFFRFSIFVFRASGDSDDMAGLLVSVQQIAGLYITRLQIVKPERNVCFRKDGFFITDFTY